MDVMSVPSGKHCKGKKVTVRNLYRVMVIQQTDAKVSAYLLLLQVVADGEVPVARLTLRLEPGTSGRDTHALHVVSQLTGLRKS